MISEWKCSGSPYLGAVLGSSDLRFRLRQIHTLVHGGTYEDELLTKWHRRHRVDSFRPESPEARVFQTLLPFRRPESVARVPGHSRTVSVDANLLSPRDTDFLSSGNVYSAAM